MPSPITDPGYRYATVKYPGNGTTVDFEYNFDGGYISKSHLVCSLRDNVDRSEEIINPVNYTVVGTNTLHLEGGFRIPVGKTLIIRRDTPKNIPLQDYMDGAILNENNLNQTTEQAIFSVAEMVDLYWEMIDLFWSVNDDVKTLLERFSELIEEWNSFKEIITEMQGDITALQDLIEALDIRVTNIENSLDDILDRLDALENAGFLTDSPADGKTYGRKDGDWVQVGVGDVEEAPKDGNKYARQDGAWAVIADGISDAPSDGKTYGRKDEAWEEIPVDDIVSTANYIKSRTLEVSLGGVFDTADEEILRLPFSEAVDGTWADHSAGTGPWRSVLGVAPTTSLVISARKNGTQFGTITFAASATTGSWDNTTGSSTVSFAIGDILTLVVSTEDTTAANFGLSVTEMEIP